MGREEVTRFVEESDCVILLGAFMTDINLGIYTAHLDPAKCIYATSETLPHQPPSLPRRAAGGFHRGADRRRRSATARARGRRRTRKPTARTSQLRPDEPITITRLMPRLERGRWTSRRW